MLLQEEVYQKALPDRLLTLSEPSPGFFSILAQEYLLTDRDPKALDAFVGNFVMVKLVREVCNVILLCLFPSTRLLWVPL